ncbi:hypothetical protein D3C76_1208510 [compost metagenome]
MLKIDVILELAIWQQFDVGFGRDKQPFIQSGIGIANIFWRQREQHAAAGAVGVAASEQVKQVEKRALAAVCQCNILWFDLPAKLFLQHGSQRFQQGVFALRAVVVAQCFSQLSLIEHLLAQLFEVAGHLWDLRRVTAAKHDGTWRAQAFIQIVHQAGDARVTGKFVAEK